MHVVFVGSMEAHGRIVAVETEYAAEMPGVVAVYTGADVAHLGQIPVNPLIQELGVPDGAVLARDKVYAVGQPVAAVVANSAAEAQDAADMVFVEIEPLPPVLDGRHGAAIFDAIPDNRAAAQRWTAGDAEAAFASAAHVVETRIVHPRLAPTALEPRAALAEWHEDGRMTVWLSTQTPHRARADLAGINGFDEAKLRVIAPDVGGAFGMKASIYPEEILVAWAAAKLERSVRWTASRAEELSAATHGRGATVEGALALDEAGTILALRATVTAPLGHWLPFSAVVPARNAARVLPGPYAVSAVDIRAEAYLSTTAPVGIYRGAGRPEGAMLIERLIDEAARKLGQDPIELRRRNLIPGSAMPHDTPTGERLDSGDFPALLDAARELIDYDSLKAERDRRCAAGEIVGIGCAVYIEPTGAGWENATASLTADGSIVAATGSTAQGQGRETAFAQIVADILQVDPEAVTVLEGDTETTPNGIGALASRSTPIGGGALVQAAEALREKARAIAAEMLQAEPDSLTLTPAGFEKTGGAVASWAEIAAHASEPLGAAATFTTKGEAWGSGACIALLSVNGDTGEPRVERMAWVDDAGTVVNPELLEGQLIGGIAQGLGEALMERVVYDADGQLLTGSFMDYQLPRAADMPRMDFGRIVTPSPLNPLGAKGVGEAGTIGAPAAILNAALDALAPFGVTELQMPLSGEKLWRAIKGLPEREE